MNGHSPVAHGQGLSGIPMAAPARLMEVEEMANEIGRVAHSIRAELSRLEVRLIGKRDEEMPDVKKPLENDEHAEEGLVGHLFDRIHETVRMLYQAQDSIMRINARE